MLKTGNPSICSPPVAAGTTTSPWTPGRRNTQPSLPQHDPRADAGDPANTCPTRPRPGRNRSARSLPVGTRQSSPFRKNIPAAAPDARSRPGGSVADQTPAGFAPPRPAPRSNHHHTPDTIGAHEPSPRPGLRASPDETPHRPAACPASAPTPHATTAASAPASTAHPYSEASTSSVSSSPPSLPTSPPEPVDRQSSGPAQPTPRPAQRVIPATAPR